MINCIDCGKELKKKTAKRCQPCDYKHRSLPGCGHGYKDGRFINKKYCLDCMLLISKWSIRCKKCNSIRSGKLIGDKLRLSYNEVKDTLSKLDFELISIKYKNANEKLIVKCNKCNKIVKSKFSSLKNRRCEGCRILGLTGPLNLNWNFSLTNEDRIKRRHYKKTYWWRKQVYNRDYYTCQVCGNSNTYLNAHHLESYHWCEELRYEVDNGITMCKDCHIKFHSIYGKQYNTTEQFVEFIQTKGN